MNKIVKLESRDIGQARKMDFGELYREAMKHGEPRIRYYHEIIAGAEPHHSARIKRNLGQSKLETSVCNGETPEQALLTAVLEAEKWGLPELEVTI